MDKSIKNNQIVRFNVEGRIFETKRVNIYKYPDSYLAKLCEENELKNKDEIIIMNRDSLRFNNIIQFLENQKLLNYNESFLFFEQIKNEAIFYGLKELVEVCDSKIELKLKNKVRLNVGGTDFSSSREVLFKSPYIKKLFEDQEKYEEKCHGIYIDRNSTYFICILDYLRTNELFMEENLSLKAILAEAKFFGLDDLVKVCEKQLNGHKKYEIISQNNLENKEIPLDWKLENFLKKDDKGYDFVFSHHVLQD